MHKARHGLMVISVFALFLAMSASTALNAEPNPRLHEGKYVGVEKCKNCHGKAATGDQYSALHKMKHAKAFETLASPDAIKLGKEQGIDSPQTNEKCLKCHVTGYEAPKEMTKKIDPKLGVQCESCHGPGDNHVKARLAAAGDSGGDDMGGFGDAEPAAYQPVPAGEILMVSAKTCKGCHNKESPSYKEFKCAERMEEILHPNPQRKRDKAKVIAEACKE